MIVMYNLALTLHLHALSILENENQQQQRTVEQQQQQQQQQQQRATTSTTAANTTNECNNNIQQQQSKSTTMFLRARKLYELAFEMHLDESGSSSSCVDVSLLFTLALINNLGLVYDVLGETQRSRTCFKNMFGTMMYLMDSQHNIHTNAHVTNSDDDNDNDDDEYLSSSSRSQHRSGIIKEWDGLLSNVMEILFQQHSLAAAPAA